MIFWLWDEWIRRRSGQTHPESLAFDADWGTQTAAFNFDNYEPSLPSVVNGLLDRLPATGRTFVDIGSGKGRVVLLASQRPFERVVGIEWDAKLHARALSNLEYAARSHPGRVPIHLFCGDAQQHPFPEGPLVVFLYNPFPADVLRRVVARLARPDVTLVYLNPFEQAVLTEWRVVDRGGEAPWAWCIAVWDPAARAPC